MASLPHLAEQNTPGRCLPPKPTTIDLCGGIYCHHCNSTFGNKKQFDSHYVNHNTGNEETVYTCVVCRKQISGYKSFQGHCYLNHVNKDKFKCQNCSKMFSKLCLLTQHEISMHTFTCMTCDQKFPSKEGLLIHEILHKVEKNKPPYPCQTCKQIIDNSDICEMHIDEHSSTSYPCPICKVTLPTKLAAVKHLSNHFGNEQSECDLMDHSEPPIEDSSIDIIGGILCCCCNDLFRNRTEFDLHFLSAHNDKDLLYTCLICKKQYDKYAMFGDHCYSHIAKNKFECDDCGKMFPRLSLLVTHTEVYHSGEAVDKPFGCTICGNAFKSNKRLIYHRRHVHSAIALDCPQCGKIFGSQRNMLLHQREHKSTQRTWCQYCSLHFTTLSSCEKHLDVHRIKNYSCPICNREYREKYLTVKHISVHFESVLHICKVCGKTYSSRSRLKQHKQTHSAIRTYMCTYCSKGFMKPAHLQQHINIHTGLKPYKCLNCPKLFATYPNWAKHLRRIHNVQFKLTMQMFDDARLNSKAVASDASATPDTEQQHFSLLEFGDNIMDDIDPATIQKELQMFCDNNNADNCEMIFDIEDLLPMNTATPVTDKAELIEASATQSCFVPAEYGPEFVNRGVETEVTANNVGSDLIDLDDHIMPHIDPLLTIKNQLFEPTDISYDNYDENASIYTPNGWEPPIVTRFYPFYSAHDDMKDFAPLSTL